MNSPLILSTDSQKDFGAILPLYEPHWTWWAVGLFGNGFICLLMFSPSLKVLGLVWDWLYMPFNVFSIVENPRACLGSSCDKMAFLFS